MSAYFDEQKRKIGARLRELFARKGRELARINPIGADLSRRLYRFSVQGKMIRGGLVTLGYQMFTPKGVEPPPQVIEAAAAVELFQSALLVHDDIMDRDITRRGLKTIFYQYARLANRRGLSESYHLGESLGICAGDVAFFLAFEVLARLEVPGELYREILELCAREISYVGVAQMQDVYWGGSGAAAREEDILRMYLYKTGRYTFSLPLMVGALLAGGPPQTVAALERLGEALGIIFQIKDDELGLFGSEEQTGKPAGSDVRAGKKTLFHEYLRRFAPAEHRRRLAGIFGNAALPAEELAYVRRLVEELGIRRAVQARVDEAAGRARRLIDELEGAGQDGRRLLEGLLEYSVARIR